MGRERKEMEKFEKMGKLIFLDPFSSSIAEKRDERENFDKLSDPTKHFL